MVKPYQPPKLDLQEFENKPWQFWTEEQRSQVILQAYKSFYISSKEVKSYLDVARRHMITQYVGPIIAGAAYFGLMRNSIAKPLYRRSATLGLLGGVGFVAVTSLLWLNFSPFYLAKREAQVKTLDLIYHKLGYTISLLNDMIPRTRTSTDIDVRCRRLYSQRNGLFTGYLYPQQTAPPFLQLNPTHIYENKKIHL